MRISHPLHLLEQRTFTAHLTNTPLLKDLQASPRFFHALFQVTKVRQALRDLLFLFLAVCAGGILIPGGDRGRLVCGDREP